MKLIKVCLFYFTILMQVGCSTMTKQVYVPVAQKCPAPSVPAKPDYPKLTKDATYSQFVRWCVVGRRMCDNYNQQLLTILEGYK